MLKLFRNKGNQNLDSQILLWFGVPPTVGGALATASGIWVLIVGESQAGTFLPAMLVSVCILCCGVGTLVYRWYRYGQKTWNKEVA